MFRKILLAVLCFVFLATDAEGQKAKRIKSCDPVPVFPIGEKPYACYRIPAIISLQGGDLLAFAEGRKTSCADFGDVDIVIKRSRDGGKTWSGLTVVVDNGDMQAGNCAPVLDLADPEFPGGRIFLFYNTGNASENSVRQGKGIREVWYVTSSDRGMTWSSPVNITMQVHRPNQPAINPEYTFPEDWRAYANTPGHAMQFSNGPYKGRIYVAANHSAGPPLADYAEGRSFGYYSDDHGRTFRISHDLPLPGSNEATAAETEDGGIYLNARNQGGNPRCRIAAFSSNGGATWDTVYYNNQLPDPVCEGSVLSMEKSGRKILLFVNPASTTERKNLTLRISRDNGITWPDSLLLVNSDAAYNDICPIGKNRIGCLFEKGSDGGIYFISVRAGF